MRMRLPFERAPASVRARNFDDMSQPQQPDGAPPHGRTYGGPPPASWHYGQPYAPPPAMPVPSAWGGPGYADPTAPFGRDPFTGQALSDKSKVAAGLLQIFLGGLGLGRFYTGHTGLAVAQLVGTVVGCVLIVSVFFSLLGLPLIIGIRIWTFVDGIVLLASRSVDARGLLLH
jgi:TM2 domain-containing membrane protein YozV